MARSRIPPLLALQLPALLLAACAQHAGVDPDRLGPGYTTGGGEWSSGGGITIAVRALPRGGTTVICGAWTTDQQSALTVRLNENVMEAGSVFLGGRRAVGNLSFMPRLAYAQDLTGAPAACVASRLPWQDGYAATAPEIRLPPMRFVVNTDNVETVAFRQGPRAAVLP